MLINTPELLELLREKVLRNPVYPLGICFRETHFGYRYMIPPQDWGKLPLENYHFCMEVHNDGLFKFARSHDLDDGSMSGSFILAKISLALKHASEIYKFVGYGGFCQISVSLGDIKGKGMHFDNHISDVSGYPSENGHLIFDYELPVSELDLVSTISIFEQRIRQAFGFRN